VMPVIHKLQSAFLRRGLVLVLSLVGILAGAVTTYAEAGLSASDRDYLTQLAKDTWACMDYFRSPVTGFPYDSNLRPGGTNTTNIGLHLTGIVAAQRLGFINKKDARQRITTILTSLKKIEHWHGFLNNHLDTGGGIKANSGFNALSDYNMLPAALIIVRQAYPDLRLADELFRRIEWDQIWDRNMNRINQGFDVKSGKQAYWGNGWLASDVRMAIFLGIATEGMPPEAFGRMERNTVNHYGLTFYRPAWDYAGLFMHALAGLFLDEKDTDIGSSAANFAYAQMQFAHDRGYPAWGWSACDRPNEGYTVDGLLSQAVIAPYASALVIDYYPQKVIGNLKTLDEMGCRKPFVENGVSHAFGFRDSINLTTGEVSQLYFCGLDQAMLLVSLANHLKSDCIRKLFQRDPVVRAGIAKLDFYQNEKDNERHRLYAQRDAQMLTSDLEDQAQDSSDEMLIDVFREETNSTLGLPRSLKVERALHTAAQVTLDDSDSDPALKIEYDFRNSPQAAAILTESLKGLDARPYNAIAFKCRAEVIDAAAGFRIKVNDAIRSRAIGFVEGLTDEWQEIQIPFEVLRGIPADLAHLNSIEFRLECTPAEFPDKPLASRQGVIYLSRLRLVRLAEAPLRTQVKYLQNFGRLARNDTGAMEGLTRMEGWQSYADGSSDLRMKVAGSPKHLEMTYALSATGKWVACEKNFKQDLPGEFELAFDMKGAGANSMLEVKMFAVGGAVFGVRLANATATPDWKHIRLTRSSFQHLWGGKSSDKLVQTERFGLAVSGAPAAKGEVAIRNMVLIFPKNPHSLSSIFSSSPGSRCTAPHPSFTQISMCTLPF